LNIIRLEEIKFCNITCDGTMSQLLFFVYSEKIKREINRILVYECRCERVRGKGEGSTRLIYNGLRGDLEHIKIETRLRDQRFESVKGQCVI
jgi:hypothetical protein